MIISEKIFFLLKQKNITQKEFSDRTGISQSTISDWKRKRTNPSADKILKICEVLQISLYELLAEDMTQEYDKEIQFRIAMNKDECVLLEEFRNLNWKQKNRLLGYINALKEV